MNSWIPGADGSEFDLDNLPLGIVDAGDGPFPATRLGERVINLSALAHRGLIAQEGLLGETTLNAFFAQGRPAWTALRARLTELFGAAASDNDEAAIEESMHRLADVTMMLPAHIGDYVDFYSSIEHATNLGRILRPGGEPLLPNYRHIPIGYHGRAGTVVSSGTPIRRPVGQSKAADAAAPAFGPSRQLDIELELGWFTGPPNALGEPIPIGRARDHIYGLVLLNDWSARDIQAWEYQPLGPFLGKSFATSISPWVVSLDALESYRVPHRVQDPTPLPYLQSAQSLTYDIRLEVVLSSAAMRVAGYAPVVVSQTTAAELYWDLGQQLAHATSNGATIAPGDLFGTGTISGSAPGTMGSFIELTSRGARPLMLPGGEQRGFLEDGDEVILRGYCERNGRRLGLGEVGGTIVAAR